MRKIHLKDPFSGITHLVGAVLSLLGLIALIIVAWGKPWHLTSLTIYGATLFLVYLASSLYHCLRVNPRIERRLFTFDRAAIYCLIAGTYTPICLIALGGGWGWSLFGIVWGLAVSGIVGDILSRSKAPDWLTALVYLVMGWIALVAIGPLMHALTPMALGLLFAGCFIYTVGAIVCVTERPRLRPGIFGAHELWHVLVLIASACHFALMLLFIARL